MALPPPKCGEMGHCTGFLGRWNYPQWRGTRPEIAGDPCHKAGDIRRQQGSHAEPGVDHEHFVALQGGAYLRDRSALQVGFTLVARGGTQYQTYQRKAHCPERADRGDHREDHGWQGLVGPGVVVLPEAPAEPRAEAADQVAGHGAQPFVPMRLPVAFLLDRLVPRLYEGLDGPASIRQRRTRAAYGLYR